MAESVASTLLVKLLGYLGQSVIIKEIIPLFGGKGELIELQKTMVMIQARLHDSERLRDAECSTLIKEWLKRLKHALHRMEDLFEEAAFLAKQNEKMSGGKLIKPLHICLSKSSPIQMNRKVVREAKTIKKELKAIATDMLSLNLRLHPREEQSSVNLKKTRETQSFILAEEVIGRENDKRAIIEMMSNSSGKTDDLLVIPIIGIGGVGKTTLAQLVFNDKNVHKDFDLRSWACISEISCLEELVGKILKSLTSNDFHNFSLEHLRSSLQEAINDKKYLLVLDDVWDEDRERWILLRRLLLGGKRGSKIILTSRSRVVAQNMGTVGPYELRGLSEGESWSLFESLAFEGKTERNANLTHIGREIVKKCANNPLAIRTIAGLLYSKDTEREWENFKKTELRMIDQDENKIMSTLKLSYTHLPSPLKQCFAYCSLFPKDYKFCTQDLIHLWMAQGFIEPSNGKHQCPEDVGYSYLIELLRRSFFQDARMNEHGEIINCKMHDLMNDLAQEVAGEDCTLVDISTEPINTMWHASFVVGSSWEAPSWLLAAKQMRTFLLLSYCTIPNVDKIVANLRCLRALDLTRADYTKFPNSIGELKHLRYLKLGASQKYLPECITRLHNLQTFDLRHSHVRKLPIRFYRMINLRHLFTGDYMIDLPLRFGQLTSLQSLDIFTVGKNIGLDELASLSNLAGRLEIRHKRRRRKVVSEARAANLKGKKITNLVLEWSGHATEVEDIEKEEDELALQCLQPPPSVKSLTVRFWGGVRFPRWGMDDFPCLLPNLVSICIEECNRCQHLPALSRLPHLKSLHLRHLNALEYIEIEGNNVGEAASVAAFFPSLEHLVLWDLHELKEWSRVKDNGTDQQRSKENHYLLRRSFFPRLSQLKIAGCPKLMSMHCALKLESLHAIRIHKQLLNNLLGAKESSIASSTPSLRELCIESVHELDSLLVNIQSLESLRIKRCQELINLIAGPATSLRLLEIHDCGNLRDISSALQHFSILEELKIQHCYELDWEDIMIMIMNDEGKIVNVKSAAEAWQGLKSLRSLHWWNIPKPMSLPRGLSCLTSLQKLYIYNLDNLSCLPEWIGNFTQLHLLEIVDCPKLLALPPSFCKLISLQQLMIWRCPELRRRCQQPHGEDWPLIQHIPQVDLGC